MKYLKDQLISIPAECCAQAYKDQPWYQVNHCNRLLCRLEVKDNKEAFGNTVSGISDTPKADDELLSEDPCLSFCRPTSSEYRSPLPSSAQGLMCFYAVSLSKVLVQNTQRNGSCLRKLPITIAISNY
uniref:Thyroglobulin type-1 domain-containing protein n=1 Tax=Syphacia muris TaxID=451379 RepID=A0A0N5B1G6_9BILA